MSEPGTDYICQPIDNVSTHSLTFNLARTAAACSRCDENVEIGTVEGFGLRPVPAYRHGDDVWNAKTGRIFKVVGISFKSNVPAEQTTPALVRELVESKCADARGEQVTQERHARLGLIVDELRSRHVLD